jgi:NADPH-dependent curcumin reductase
LGHGLRTLERPPVPERRRQWVLARRPEGPLAAENFRLVDAPIPALREGEFLLRTLYLSLAPVMRQYMIDGAGIEPPLAPGDVIHGRGVGQVVASRSKVHPVGTIVHGKLGWQDHAVSDGAPDKLMFPVAARDLPLSTSLGVLGITGFSAYVGLFDIGRPKPRETVLVTGAAGGVGSVAGQLARIAGCRVVGVAGSNAKCAMLMNELGFDAAINYRTDQVEEQLAAAVPSGIDIIYDNVGGPLLDMALARINRFARVVSCGRISQYVDGPNHALTNWWMIGEHSARMQGFFVYDYADRFAEAEARMSQWIREGRLSWREDVLDGFERMPEALARLFDGRNLGKQVVRVADPLSDAELGL